MSDQVVRLLIVAVLFLHGVAHVGPIGTYLWIRARPQDKTGGWVGARTWLVPGLSPSAATALACVLWAVCIIGFVGAALSFLGILVPGELWRQLAIGSAIVSVLGIAAFFGTWPMFNTLAALAVNAAVLVAQLLLHWPTETLSGY